MPEAERTLVKSPPELWAVVSDAEALARHLGEFGEIRITRLEPETTVTWEGDTARGTVELEPEGWGTKVTLRAETVEPEPEPAVAPEPEPAAAAPPEPEPVRLGLWARLRRRQQPVPVPEPVPEPVAPAAPEPAPDGDPATVLTAVLDDLGAAHHRPFSRG